MIQSDNNSPAVHPADENPEEALRQLKAKNRKAIRRRVAILSLAILTAAGFEWRRDIGIWAIGRWKILGSGGDSIGSEAAIRLIYEDNALVVDVREPAEYRISHLVGARPLPIEVLKKSGWPSEWPTGRPVLVYCTIGERGGEAASIISAKGIRAQAIIGGIIALAHANEPLDCEEGRTWRVSVGSTDYRWLLPTSYEAVSSSGSTK